MDYWIRPVEMKDARDLNALRRMPGVFENILGIPSEALKRSEAFLSGLDGNHHQFVALTKMPSGEELVIGTAGLGVGQNPRLRHIGSIGIMVHKDYQGQGVGRTLMEALLDLADHWLMLLRVELSVFEDNHRAIALYESLGFEKEGLKRLGAVRDGVYENEYYMSRIRPGGLDFSKKE